MSNLDFLNFQFPVSVVGGEETRDLCMLASARRAAGGKIHKFLWVDCSFSDNLT
jgi:hypothetical protein